MNIRVGTLDRIAPDLDSGLQDVFFEVLQNVLGTVESFRDDQTHAHERRIALLVECVAEHLGFACEDARRIASASMFHDIGKLGVPEQLLNRPGRLNRSEVDLVRRHARIGYDILRRGCGELSGVAASIALNHHERWDGTGYPQGLSGPQIPMPAAIVALCDVYDALRSDRPYQSALSHEDACCVILLGDGRTAPQHFNPEVLRAFEALADQFAAIHVEQTDAVSEFIGSRPPMPELLR